MTTSVYTPVISPADTGGMTRNHSILRRSRRALAAAGAVAFLLATMVRGGTAQAAAVIGF